MKQGILIGIEQSGESKALTELLPFDEVKTAYRSEIEKPSGDFCKLEIWSQRGVVKRSAIKISPEAEKPAKKKSTKKTAAKKSPAND